jgi:hypothetical protein
MTEPNEHPTHDQAPETPASPWSQPAWSQSASPPGDPLVVAPQPVQPTTTPPRRIAPWRIALVVGALAIAAGSAAIAFAASPSPSAGGTSTAPSTDNGWTAPNGSGPGMFGRGGMFGDHGGRAGVSGAITITAISGSNVSLKTADGWTRTIAVTDSTTITKGGQTIGVSDLKVGDTVVFRQTRQSDGSYTIDSITVVVPTIDGTVKDVTSSGFTVTTRDGLTWTVTVSSSTVYHLGSSDATGSKSDVTAGAEVVVQGTQGTGNTIAATSVRVEMPRVGGQVSAKDGSTLTVKRQDGTTFTVKTTSSTTYRVAGVTNPTLSDITVGMWIAAEGPQGSDGSITALVVAAGQGGDRGGPGFGGPGFGGPGRGHGGWGPGGGAQPAPSASPSGSTG